MDAWILVPRSPFLSQIFDSCQHMKIGCITGLCQNLKLRENPNIYLFYSIRKVLTLLKTWLISMCSPLIYSILIWVHVWGIEHDACLQTSFFLSILLSIPFCVKLFTLISYVQSVIHIFYIFYIYTYILCDIDSILLYVQILNFVCHYK